MKYQVSALFISVATLCSQAQGVMDQSFVPDRSVLTGGSTPIAHAQTFTVGLSGMLTSFDVYLNGVNGYPGSMLWEIRRTVGGAPINDSAPTLASGSIYSSDLPIQGSLPLFVSFQLPSDGVNVAAGESLAIVLSPNASYQWSGEWGDGSRDPYGFGSHFAKLSDGSWVQNSGVDMGFRTFVQAVPEPSAIAILTIGSSAIWWSLRRRARL